MRKNTWKAAVVAALAGSVFQFGLGACGQALEGGIVEVFAEQVAGLITGFLNPA
jgi:hypothetical protein